jgi:DNA polymerase-3 subunit epsilon
LRTDGAEPVFKTFLNARSQETTLPPGLPKQTYANLPTAPGVYYFKNAKGKIIYIGKAINIKKRVLSHFYDKAIKEITMCAETTDIDFELSGSDLLALLMESAAIKHHYPEYNRSQKRNVQRYGIFSYEDRNGILHLAFNKIKMAPNPVVILYNTTDCRLYLEEICKSFSLCAKFCHLQEKVDTCSHYRIKKCDGICRGDETVEDYNKKVGKALSYIRDQSQNLVIQEKGRALNESAFVLIKNGTYMGYGFIDKETQINSFEELEPHVLSQKNTLETERIVQSYLTRNPKKSKPFMAI